MKIIRWLLSHSLFILLIVAVIYGYMFWGNLLGKDTPAGKAVAYLSEEFVEVKAFVDAVRAKQAEVSENKASAQAASANAAASSTEDADTTPQTTIVEVESAENTDEIASQPIEQPVIEQPVIEQPVIEQQEAVAEAEVEQQPAFEVQNDMAAAQQSASSIDSRDEAELSTQTNNAAIANNQQNTSVVSPQFVSADADKSAALAVTNIYPGKKFVPAEVEKHLNNVDEHGEVINASQPTGAVREKWITARKSFYQRNYELSEKSYQEVIDSTKNNFDAYGELGNVYFNQGKNKEAAAAYFEAAAILINKGQVYRAKSLMGLLRHLDESKAGKLQQLIDEAQS